VYRMTDQLTNMMLYPDGQMPSGGYVRATIELLRKPGNSDLIKKRALEGIATLFRSADSATSFTVFLGLDSIPELADEAEKQGFSDLATGLRKRYQELKNMDSEEP